MWRSRPIARQTECGFTLLELLVALTLVALLMGGVYEPVFVGLRTVQATDQREDLRTQLARALDRLTREARMTRNVDVADETQFRFDADFTGDGQSQAGAGETDIQYRVQNGDFQRSQGTNAAFTLVPDVSAVAFDYVDVTGTAHDVCGGGCTASTLRVVQVTITAAKNGETVSLAGAAYLENM